MQAWHCVSSLDHRLTRDMEHEIARVGQTYTTPDPKRPIRVCVYGLHGSTSILQAYALSAATTLCRVELSGEIVRHGTNYAARHRTILWMKELDGEFTMAGLHTLRTFLERRTIRLPKKALNKALDLCEESCWEEAQELLNRLTRLPDTPHHQAQNSIVRCFEAVAYGSMEIGTRLEYLGIKFPNTDLRNTFNNYIKQYVPEEYR